MTSSTSKYLCLSKGMTYMSIPHISGCIFSSFIYLFFNNKADTRPFFFTCSP